MYISSYKYSYNVHFVVPPAILPDGRIWGMFSIWPPWKWRTKSVGSANRHQCTVVFYFPMRSLKHYFFQDYVIIRILFNMFLVTGYFFFIFILYSLVFFLHVCLYEGSPGSTVRDSCELSWGCWESVQPMLSSATYKFFPTVFFFY